MCAFINPFSSGSFKGHNEFEKWWERFVAQGYEAGTHYYRTAPIIIIITTIYCIYNLPFNLKDTNMAAYVAVDSPTLYHAIPVGMDSLTN